MEVHDAIMHRKSVRSYQNRPIEEEKLLGIPERVVVVELLPMGYPADASLKEKKRKPLAEILHREAW